MRYLRYSDHTNHTAWGKGTLRKPIAVTAALFLALVLGSPLVFAEQVPTTDADDAGAVDVQSVSHRLKDGVLVYGVQFFDGVRAEQISAARWSFDLDGDGEAAGEDDACLEVERMQGTKILRAALLEGCHESIATTDVNVNDDTLKVKLLLEELQDAGLREGAAYAYRFGVMDRSGSLDTVPDDASDLIVHTIGVASATSDGSAPPPRSQPTTPAPDHASTSEDVVEGQVAMSVDGVSPDAAEAGVAGAEEPVSGAEEKDSKITGQADESVIEPGDDVDIAGGGFGALKPLVMTLVSTTATGTVTPSATPTAVQSASPSPSASASPSTSAAQAAEVGTAAKKKKGGGGRRPGGRIAPRPSVDGVWLGIALSDQDGTFEDDVEIPESTEPGDYLIVVEGRNRSGGRHRVDVPIAVAAEVENGTGAGTGNTAASPGASGGGTAPTNATGTVTQASPGAGAGTGTTGGGGAALPTTGSQLVQTLFGLGLITLMLGLSLSVVKRLLRRRPQQLVAATPHVPLVLDVPGDLRGEMQRLLSFRTDRYPGSP